jgi:DNA-binding response OmpR family regulator
LIGLSVGADDYITKPFSNRELVARAAVCRPRRPRRPRDRGSAGVRRLRIDAAGREVWVGDVKVALTRTEFDILEAISLSRTPC